MKFLKVYILLFISLFCIGCDSSSLEGAIHETVSENSDKIVIHYLDVGQGDSSFIEFPNHEVMLIDAGEAEYGSKVVQYIQSLGYQKIDYLVGTHPHSDHIGGLKKVVNTLDIGQVYMPKAISTSATYLNLLKAMESKGLTIINAKAGMNILQTEDLQIDVLAPNSTDYSSLNNYSIVLKIRYKDRTFLFTGDAESLSEQEILKNGYDVSGDVIKVGHHGSDTSSSLSFVEKVHAQYAIISVGEDNSYKHPNASILERWENHGAKVYRTDLLGNIVVTSDGDGIQVQSSASSLEKLEEEKDPSSESSIALIDLTDPIQRGKDATIQIHGKPNTSYTIHVFYKSGVSTTSGLEDKMSDPNGFVSWTWKVSGNVSLGNYQIVVTDGQEEKVIPYVIVE